MGHPNELAPRVRYSYLLHSLFRHSRSVGKPPLRVGLLIDSTDLMQTFAEILDSVQATDFAKIVLVIRHDSPTACGPPRKMSKLRKIVARLRDAKLRRSFLFDLYWKWDQKRISAELNPATEVDCRQRLQGIPCLDVQPITKGFTHRFPEEALEAIKGHDLDVLIRFGFNILRGGILTAARYGMWSYHHGDNDFYRGGPAHMWEVIEKNPVSGVILQILNEKLDEGFVLQKGLFASESGFSVLRNRLRPYWGSTYFMVEKLLELHERGFASLQANAVAPAPYQGKVKIYRSPSNYEMARWLVPEILRKSSRIVSRPYSFATHWQIGIRRGSPPAPGEAALEEFKILDAPAGFYRADPFLAPGWLFFEELDLASNRAHLSVASISADGSGLGEPTRILEKPHHLSYPCVFEHNGDWWMIPESCEAGTVELYRAKSFPFDWQHEKTLFHAPAADTTPLFIDGRFYFFTTMIEKRTDAGVLCLFTADSLTGDWKLHSIPSTDVRHSRQGGAFRRRGDQLYRISQDCSVRYGYGTGWHEVLEINDRVYRERQVASFHLDNEHVANQFNGAHTYNECGDYQVIDLQSLKRTGLRTHL